MVGYGVRPGISMAEGEGGMGVVGCARGPTGGKLMRVDVDEGEVVSRKDQDCVEPGGRGIMRIQGKGEGVLVGRGIECRDAMYCSADLGSNSGNGSIVMGLEGGEEGRGGKRVGRGGCGGVQGDE